MASDSTATKKLREEASCSICQQLMVEPVSINCGHSFCRMCIVNFIENQKEMSSVETFCCPECHTQFQKESIRPIKQLEILIETIKEMEHEKLCEEHGEPFHLFCQDDGQLICWYCERTPQHKGHHTDLLKDACQFYQKKFQEAVIKLRKLEDQCKRWKLSTRDHIIKWEEKINLRKQKIQSDFKNLYYFLHEEEKSFLWKLENEKEQVLKRLQDCEAKLDKQSEELKKQILELERKCQGSAQKLLQDVKGTLSRSSAVKLKTPEAPSLEVHTECSVSKLYFDMRKFLESYEASVILDPGTAHSELILSDNGRQVTRGSTQMKSNIPERFRVLPCVLGHDVFISGRHYFEVYMGKGTEWDIGVCLENVPRDSDITLKPQFGFWALRRCKQYGYVALTSPRTPLQLREELEFVGVFLDQEAGLVSFYNMNTGSHIFTFPKASFSHSLRPYFRIGKDSLLSLPSSRHVNKEADSPASLV
ncbi:E3 ubiquitin-protein ligase TRIM38 [Sorex araneus]|uniref:E3 ubiquitin-protein ligase TRIM38 n=1 Tax=Sorex araneus TaxID=42254 RepID=UPI0024340029|nr:E3 ubiquitin-protein ligase TRIM38 [Sorex araneus]